MVALVLSSQYEHSRSPRATATRMESLRRVEAGEEVTITVSGRPSARLVAVAPQTWRSDADVRELFDGEADPEWENDR